MTLATLRRGVPDDATCIGLLAIQVFLDTYATEGVRPDLAREALGEYSPARFEQRLRDENRSFILAEAGECLLGFAEVRTKPSAIPALGNARSGLELVRLYVQPAAQRAGLGRRLLRASELLCKGCGAEILWLTVWSGNMRALAFYRALGYVDVGASTYTFQGNSYENRVMTQSAPAGYSGTPLAKKLGYKPGHCAVVLNAPDGYDSLLHPLPAGVLFEKAASKGTDLVHVFVTRRPALSRQLVALRKALKPDAFVWVSWPKKASRVPTDITEDVIREVALPLGFVDIKVCAVNEVWSGLKLVVRKELRHMDPA